MGGIIMIDKVRQEIEDWFDERVLSQNQEYRIIGLVDREELKDRITKDIKEFIKRLKEGINLIGDEITPFNMKDCIDKLAGDKLK